MPLPIIDVPTFDLTIPSTDKNIKCRPFLVKEEKILLMALETRNEREILNAIKQVVNNCIIDFNGHDLDKIASFDYEYIILKLRARAKGEVLKIQYKGLEDVECEECKKPKVISIDLNLVEVKKNKNHTNKIQLTDDIGVTMTYPKLTYINDLIDTQTKDDALRNFLLVVNCIENIYDKENVYTKKEVGQKDIEEFVEKLTSEQFDKLYEFIITMPRLEHEIDLTCQTCGRKETQVISGLHNFFL